MQWSLLAAVTLLHATHASEPALRVDASGVVRATLRKGESMTANSACVVGCSGRASSGRLVRSTPLVALGRKKRWWQRGLLRMKDSPFWNNHFLDCDGVHVRGVTIEAPDDSPNTDGWDPDSATNVLIEDSSYRGGDDCIAIKSGWDCFGVAYGKPSANITVRNLTCDGRVADAIPKNQ